MKKLDLEIVRQAIENYNKKYLTEYLGTSDEPELVNEPSSPIPLLDKNNQPMYGEEFFDLMIANLLLRECDPKQYPISANVAELVTRLGYEGLRHCDIMTNDYARREFCNQVALNKLPERGQVWNYLLWIERYKENALPIWFYYTLLLWVMLEDKHPYQYSYRSRVLLGISMKYTLTQISDYHAERYHDKFRIQPLMMRVIKACCKHEFKESEWRQLVPYLLSSLREFSILTFGFMLSRSCAFEIFRPLGMVTRVRSEKFHQMVVDQFYNKHYQHEEKS